MGKGNNNRQKTRPHMDFGGAVREIGVFVALIIMVIIFALIDPSYVTVGNFVDIVKQATINGILAIGITFAIISGGIDLSLGSTFAIVIVAVGQLTVMGIPPLAAIAAGAVLGTFMGSINGLLVTKMRLQPFIATLGTMSVFRGIAYVVTGGWPVLNIPDAYRKSLGAKVIGDVPISIFVLFAIAVIAHILLKKTRFGNYLFAVGGNEEAAKLSGVNVDRTKIIGLCISNGLIALSGALIAHYVGYSDASSSSGTLIYGLAAVIIGEALFSLFPRGRRGVTLGLVSAVCGSIIYKMIVTFVVDAELFGDNSANLMKLLCAVIVAITLIIPAMKDAVATWKNKREARRA